MANDIKILIDVITKGEQNVKTLNDVINTGFNRGKLAVEAFNAATGNGHKAIKSLNLGVGDLVKTYLSISAAKAAFTSMIDILKKGEQAQFAMTSSVQAANREFQNTGSLAYWKAAVKDLSKELQVYSESAIEGAVSRTVDMTKRLGLSADQMKVLISRTADLSAGKTDLNGGIERVTSALRGEAEASEYLGLTLNETYIKAWYETHTAHEKAWKDLNDLEKAQLRYQVFLEQTAAFQGKASDSAKTFNGALMLLNKAIEDSVMNNEDLAAAMSDVAKFIRENSASIGDMAATLITVTAKVAEFALEWKEVILALGAVWGVTKGIQFLSTVITGLSAAMAVLRAAKTSQVMLDMAAAATQAKVAGLALSTWMSGGLALAATFAVTQIWRLVDAYMQLKHWQEVAKEADKDRVAIDTKAGEKAQELGKQLGMNINSLSDFNRLVKEGRIVWDNQTQSWQKATQATQDQARAVELTEEKLKALEKTVEDLGRGYTQLQSRVSRYYDFAADKAAALAKDERSAILSTLDIHRQKTQTLLQLAEQQAEQETQIIQRSGASEKQQAELVKKVAEDLKTAKIKTIEDWESKLQAALLKGIAEEQKYAEEVKRLQADLALAKMSTEEKIRELNRRTMTEEQAWNDQRAQAYETLKRAQEAIASATTPDGLQQAKALAEKAQQQFASLAGEVKNGDQVIKTEAQTVQEAVKGVKEAGDVLSQAIEKQITAAETNRKNWQTTNTEIQAGLDGIKGKIEEINSTPITPSAEFKVDSAAVDARIQELNNTVTHSVHIVHVQTVQENSLGGMIRQFAAGGWNRLSGQLPGWGGGDRVRALLEDGEFVVRKEAVRKYGAALFSALNSMRIDIPKLLASTLPIMPDLPKTAFAAGGAVAVGSTTQETIIWRHQVGGEEYPIAVNASSRDQLKSLEKALSKMRLTRGR